jgi:hypothetical protein
MRLNLKPIVAKTHGDRCASRWVLIARIPKVLLYEPASPGGQCFRRLVEAAKWFSFLRLSGVHHACRLSVDVCRFDM